MKHRKFPLPIVVLVIVLLAGCGSAAEKQPAASNLPGDETVLARVNGSRITRYDLDASIQNMLGAQSAKMLDADGRRKMLASLVAARAIAQAQEKTLDSRQKSEIDRKTAAYREQLLVKMYLARNTRPEPVSRQMVQDYYDHHPEQFGAATVRTYEMISTDTGLTDAARDQLLTALAAPDKLDDWPSVVARLRRKGLPVTYRKASSDARILSPQLRGLISRLAPGQCSDPTFIDNTLYMTRILAEKKIPARPLNEVSARIRKILLPVQLKKAVKQASDQVLGKANVEYLNASVRDERK
jgi:hypothetical protein